MKLVRLKEKYYTDRSSRWGDNWRQWDGSSFTVQLRKDGREYIGVEVEGLGLRANFSMSGYDPRVITKAYNDTSKLFEMFFKKTGGGKDVDRETLEDLVRVAISGHYWDKNGNMDFKKKPEMDDPRIEADNRSFLNKAKRMSKDFVSHSDLKLDNMDVVYVDDDPYERPRCVGSEVIGYTIRDNQMIIGSQRVITRRGGFEQYKPKVLTIDVDGSDLDYFMTGTYGSEDKSGTITLNSATPDEIFDSLAKDIDDLMKSSFKVKKLSSNTMTATKTTSKIRDGFNIYVIDEFLQDTVKKLDR